MFIDIHTHVGETPEFHFFDISLATWLQKMDRLNILYAVSAHMDVLTGTDYLNNAGECLKLYEDSGGRVMSYFVYNPNMAEECIQVIRKYAGNPAFRGIKIHPTIHRTYADDARYDPVYVCAREKNLPVMTHCWCLSAHNDAQKYSTPGLFVKYAEKYSDVNLILAHSGGRIDGIREAARIAARYPNVYLDTSGDVYPLGLIEYLVSEVSADKILFGSDAMWICPSTQIGMIAGADITHEDKKKILCDNARRVFRIGMNDSSNCYN